MAYGLTDGIDPGALRRALVIGEPLYLSAGFDFK